MRTIGALAALCLLAGCGLLAQYDDGNAMVEAVRLQVDRVVPQGSGDPSEAGVRRFYEARDWYDDDSEQHAVIAGIVLDEMRYRRRLPTTA